MADVGLAGVVGGNHRRLHVRVQRIEQVVGVLLGDEVAREPTAAHE